LIGVMSGGAASSGERVGPLVNSYHFSSPSLLFRVDLTGRCAEGGGSEVPMQVLSSYSARFRKWLGQLGKKQSPEAP